ncbi:MAG: 50S ribosomal protein L21 [Acidimicrobiia bacterium]|nr:50S ribosomal protein L21 [Acidimicrobiia bacterium]
MQAVIKTGGKQYRVAEGDVLDVELLDAEPGDEVDIDPVVLFDGADLVRAGGSVRARVVEHGKGKKLVVFKYKPKTGYRRKNGHRQRFSRIEITSISAEGK